MKQILTALAAISLLALSNPASAAAPDTKSILTTYADIAHATYEDSLITAKTLRDKINQLAASPTTGALNAAREAWLAARVPYQQSEAYRFGNAIVDDWEGKVNAWPLDEGLIDYVDAQYGTESDENQFYTINVVANESIRVGGEQIDARTIDKVLLGEKLHEIGGVEANVATGYHAIEFLLWGQDLNGNGAGAGARPATDFDTSNCSNGHCERRVAYLKAAAELLIDDLEEMVAAWGRTGEARNGLLAEAGDAGLARILTGMGSLSYGELAGERMQLGLMLHDPEEEHDCFSDNTHNSHYYDALGIRNVYLGSYKRVDGSTVSGASLQALVADKAPAVDAEMRKALDVTQAAMGEMVKTAEGGKAYDQMIASGDAAGNATVQAVVDSLTAQTRVIERVVSALDLEKIEFEGSDSLDNPSAVFQ